MSREKKPFRFKQFVVRHDRSMKVGTDAVLLGAWADVRNANALLDVGTGSGIIALMLAQRTLPEARIEAIEIDKISYGEASENITHSPWPEKIKVLHTSLQEFHPDMKFDHMVSNPPYFIGSLLPASPAREHARHTSSLSYPALLTSVKDHLKVTGKLSIILPTVEGEHFQSMAAQMGYHCSRRLAFFSRKGKPQERWLMEFIFSPVSTVTDRLILYDDGEEWSKEYKALTGAFYLSA